MPHTDRDMIPVAYTTHNRDNCEMKYDIMVDILDYTGNYSCLRYVSGFDLDRCTLCYEHNGDKAEIEHDGRHSWLQVMMSCVRCINPLHAKFFRGNKNIYLHFMSILYIDMTQVIGIFPHERPRLVFFTWTISWLLMTWKCKEPRHHQPWYWLD